jgi:hypothetical protein
MKARLASHLALGISLLTLLSACGSDAAPPASTAGIDNFVSEYNRGLASVAGMNTTAFADLIDDEFLDSGYDKSQLLANVKADAAAQADAASGIPADQVFPLLKIKDASVSGCNDATGVCTLTATYVNPDPDATTATVAVPVRYGKDGIFRLFGDQQKTAS